MAHSGYISRDIIENSGGILTRERRDLVLKTDLPNGFVVVRQETTKDQYNDEDIASVYEGAIHITASLDGVSYEGYIYSSGSQYWTKETASGAMRRIDDKKVPTALTEAVEFFKTDDGRNKAEVYTANLVAKRIDELSAQKQMLQDYLFELIER